MRRRSVKEWAAIAEIVGGVAVIISLLFVALSIRQNTQAIEATTWESFLDRSERINLAIAGSDDLARIIQEGESDPGQLTGEDYFRFSHAARIRFGAWEAIFNHYQVGRLSANSWEVWNAFYLDLLDHPGYRQVWLEIEQWYDPKFRLMMRSQYLENPPGD